jgi:acetolactate synthase-1/2/3 large subunit
LYVGNFGVFGGRAGNFIVQNADLLLALGARMSFKQTGFNFSGFSPKSKKIIVDVDEPELKKPTIKIDSALHLDLRDVIDCLNKTLKTSLPAKAAWIKYAETLKEKFKYDEREYMKGDLVNPYYLSIRLVRLADRDCVIVVGNSCASVSMLQVGIAKNRQRLFGNVNCGSMGYDIPAAIGAAAAAGKPVICATGDGSFQMNIQELQTIVNYNLPAKFIIFNNGGYQAVVQSQATFFNNRLSGCTPESGLTFPSFKKIAYAYDIPYEIVENNTDVDDKLKWLLEQKSYCMLEVMQDTRQPIEPKVMSKKAADGSIYSPPLDDLSPFLPEEIYNEYANFAN